MRQNDGLLDPVWLSQGVLVLVKAQQQVCVSGTPQMSQSGGSFTLGVVKESLKFFNYPYLFCGRPNMCSIPTDSV